MIKKFAIKINKINKIFKEKTVLDNVSFSLYFAQKVALIGSNGSGKSTLGKIISGLEKQDSGDIEIFKKFNVSYLPQEFLENVTVSDYLKFENIAAEKRTKIFNNLKKFKLNDDILNRDIFTLSGGEKNKIFLIKISLDESEIIILDEPTNNLDYEGIKYLEELIKNSKSAFLIISHDRKFLDRTVSSVIDLDENNHNIKIYDGNYSDYVDQKNSDNDRIEGLYAQSQKQKSKYEKEVSKQKSKSSREMKTSVMRNDSNKMSADKQIESVGRMAGRNLKRAKLKLENFNEKENIIIKRPLKINFSEMKNSGFDVLKVLDIKKIFNDKIIGPISFNISLGDRFLIRGRNGAGKTTVVKMILDAYKNKNKKIIFGFNVVLGYLPQSLDYGIKYENFLEYFLDKSGKKQTDARKILNRFGFTEEDVFQKISELSPGVRSRGKIALMMVNNPNLLILDEPTNNLDLEVLEKFEESLKEYKGTIIFISHDEYFIEKIKPNKTLKIE